jgi:hypothetical protein
VKFHPALYGTDALSAPLRAPQPDEDLFEPAEDSHDADVSADPEISRLHGVIAALKTILRQREKHAGSVITRLRMAEEKNKELLLQLEAARRAGRELSRRLLDSEALLGIRDAEVQAAKAECTELRSNLNRSQREALDYSAALQSAQQRHDRELLAARNAGAAASEQIEALTREIKGLQVIRREERNQAEADITALSQQLRNERSAYIAAERSSNLLREEVTALLPTLKAAATGR